MESESGPTEGEMGARQRAGLGSGPTEGKMGARRRAGLGSGPTAGLGGGPTGDYISAAGPHFWALSSSAQSHLQEMQVCRVLMSESVL
jgi:hypothetical protein